VLGSSRRQTHEFADGFCLLTTITACGKSWVHSAQRKTRGSAHRKQPGGAIIEVDRELFDAFAPHIIHSSVVPDAIW
jgi:hypothetical protein